MKPLLTTNNHGNSKVSLHDFPLDTLGPSFLGFGLNSNIFSNFFLRQVDINVYA